MPRTARAKGEFSTYHIVQRGNERKDIFIYDDDKKMFLDILLKMKNKYNFKLEAYCIMDNHVHLLINDNGNDISKIVKSINISYAYYFNKKYKRVGHLFQDRFKSELVKDENYLMTLSAYIHNNPIKAGMVKLPEQYKWSSYNCYISKDKNKFDLVEIERILSLFSNSKRVAIQEYSNYVIKFEMKTEILDVEEDVILIKKENANYIETYNEGLKLVAMELEKKSKRKEDLMKDKILRQEVMVKLRQNSNLTLGEIGQLVGGLTASAVCRILKT